MIKVRPKIIIGGVPRTGKSNLAKKLFERFHGPVIHGDTLVNIVKNNSANPFGIDPDSFALNNPTQFLLPIQKFIVKVTRNMGKDLGYELLIFESCYVLPETIAKLSLEGPVCGVFLLYDHLDIEQKIQDIRQYALTNQHCWSHKNTDSELYQSLTDFIILSQFFRQECQKHGVRWFDMDDQWKMRWTSAYEFIVQVAVFHLDIKSR